MALSLMMILHELAANSAKHGAFGCEAGRLRVRWLDVGPPESSELQLSWEEFGRSPGSKHDGRGYGFTLIDSTTKALGARVQRSFRDGGISVELTIPLR
jgi:two-component sensor histidine kinase